MTYQLSNKAKSLKKYLTQRNVLDNDLEDYYTNFISKNFNTNEEFPDFSGEKFGLNIKDGELFYGFYFLNKHHRKKVFLKKNFKLEEFEFKHDLQSEKDLGSFEKSNEYVFKGTEESYIHEEWFQPFMISRNKEYVEDIMELTILANEARLLKNKPIQKSYEFIDMIEEKIDTVLKKYKNLISPLHNSDVIRDYFYYLNREGVNRDFLSKKFNINNFSNGLPNEMLNINSNKIFDLLMEDANLVNMELCGSHMMIKINSNKLQKKEMEILL